MQWVPGVLGTEALVGSWKLGEQSSTVEGNRAGLLDGLRLGCERQSHPRPVGIWIPTQLTFQAASES